MYHMSSLSITRKCITSTDRTHRRVRYQAGSIVLFKLHGCIFTEPCTDETKEQAHFKPNDISIMTHDFMMSRFMNVTCEREHSWPYIFASKRPTRRQPSLGYPPSMLDFTFMFCHQTTNQTLTCPPHPGPIRTTRETRVMVSRQNENFILGARGLTR